MHDPHIMCILIGFYGFHIHKLIQAKFAKSMTAAAAAAHEGA